MARIYGLNNAEVNEIWSSTTALKAIVGWTWKRITGAVAAGPTDKIKEGFTVKRTRRIASMAGWSMLGRVIDPARANRSDGKGRIGGELYEMPLGAQGTGSNLPVSRLTSRCKRVLKAIDAMIPIGRGQRELLIGDRQTGKTAIAWMPSLTSVPTTKRAIRVYYLCG